MRYCLLLLFCGIITAEGRRKREETLLRQAQPGNVTQDGNPNTMAETGSILSTEPEAQTQTIEDEIKANIVTKATTYVIEITTETSKDRDAAETTTDTIKATTNNSDEIQAEETTITDVSKATSETFKKSLSATGVATTEITKESQDVEAHTDVFKTTTETIKESQDAEVTSYVNKSTPEISEEGQNTDTTMAIIETKSETFENSQDGEETTDVNESTPKISEVQDTKATKNIFETPETLKKSQAAESSEDFNEATPKIPKKSQNEEEPNEGRKSPPELMDETKTGKIQKIHLKKRGQTPNQAEGYKENSAFQQEQISISSPGRKALAGEVELAYLPKIQRFLEEFSKVLKNESPTIKVEENLQNFLTPGYCELNITSSEHLPLGETSTSEMSTKPSSHTEDPQVFKLIMEYYTEQQQKRKQSSVPTEAEAATQAELLIGNLQGLTGVLGLLQSGFILGNGSLQVPTNLQSIMSSLQPTAPTLGDDKKMSSDIVTVQSKEQLTSTVDKLLEAIEHLRLLKSSRKKLETYFKDKGRSDMSGSDRYYLIQYLKYLESESESSSSLEARKRFDEHTLKNELRYFNLPSSITQEFAEGLSRRFSNRKFNRKNKNPNKNRNRTRDNDGNIERYEDLDRNRNRNDGQEEDRKEDRDRIRNRDRYKNRNKNRDEDRDEDRYRERDNHNNKDRNRNYHRDRGVDRNNERNGDRNWDRNIDQETFLKQSRLIEGKNDFKSGNIKIVGFESFKISKIAVKTDVVNGPRVDLQVDFGPLALLPIDVSNKAPAKAEFLLPVSFGLVVRGRSRKYLQLKNFQSPNISPFDILLSECLDTRTSVMMTYKVNISEALKRRKSFVHSIESILLSFVLMESTKDLFDDLNLARQ